jgi:hypothetical protein
VLESGVSWLKDLFGSRPAPLTGAPAVRRLKSYSAQSGYVYQYYYEGQRTARGGAATEFVFSVSADRKTHFAVPVCVAESAVAEWERARGRALSSTERYAIAKMALFRAFDERQSPEAMNAAVEVGSLAVAEHLEALKID